MSSPRTEPTDQPDTAGEKPKSTLSITQVSGGAVAAVSSAVVASFFGVAGTLVGAALASVISTVTAALYTNSLSRTNDRLRRVRSQLAGAPAPQAGSQEAAPDAALSSAEAPPTRVLPASLDPRRAPAPRRGPRWPRVAGYAVAVFGLAMAIVTGIEIAGQQPVSALVGVDEASSTTTLGELADASSSRDTTPDTPSTTPSPSTTSQAPESESDATDPGDNTGTGTTAPSTSSESPQETATSTAEPTGTSDDAPQTETEQEQEQP